MMSRTLLAASALLAASCTASHPTPSAQAAASEANCKRAPATDAHIVGAAHVDQVEPLYSVVYSTPNGAESRLIGATLHIQAIEGATAESLSRALACHGRGESGAIEGCPYSAVPGAWVDIDVKADGSGYEVALRAQDGDGARQILERARACTRN